MSAVEARLRQTLSRSGHSLTKPRLAVFNSLQEGEPLAVRDLIAKVPKIDRASVYRSIKVFEKLGVIERLQIGWKYKIELSDVFSPHHHHLICTNCGRIVAFEEEPALENYLKRVAKGKGFTAVKHQLEMTGLCPNCTKLLS